MKKNLRRNSEESQKRSRKKTIRAAVAIVFLIGVILGGNIISLHNKNKEDEKKIAELEAKKQYEEQRAEELEELEEMIDSDEYVEKIAREKFNLSYPGDIIFVPSGNR